MAADDDRLSRLSTQWTLLARAHQRADPAAAREAQAELLVRYHAAAYRYLARVVGDAAAAEELCQEFAYRFVRGDFRGARPDKGRFRDYVKTALVRMAGEYRRARQAGDRVRPFDSRVMTPADPDPDAAFREEWRQAVLDLVWAALKREATGPRPTGYDVLRRKAADPSVPSARLAETLTAQLGRPVTAANVRQLLHRARRRFAELLRAEVAASVATTDSAEVEAELADLGLLVYVNRPGG